MTNIKIMNLHQEYDNDKLVEIIKVQNENITNGSITVTKTYKNNHKNNYEALIQCDVISYNEIMKEAKLRIGWSVCKVIDYVEVNRCYNCCGYNHIASKCKNKTVLRM